MRVDILKDMNNVCSASPVQRPRRHFSLIVALCIMVLALGIFSSTSAAHAAVRTPVQTLDPTNGGWTLPAGDSYSFIGSTGHLFFYHDHVQIGGELDNLTNDCASVSFIVTENGMTGNPLTRHACPDGSGIAPSRDFGTSLYTNAPTGMGYTLKITLYQGTTAIATQTSTYAPSGKVTTA
jgi:hypothetical protein